MSSSNIKVGDICVYSYDTQNKSITIVEVIQELSEEVVAVKFHQVICDDSGNDLFEYLLKSGKSMNVSKKYLVRIDIVFEKVKEFAEKLKEQIYIKKDRLFYAEKIDTLVKEMAGDDQ